MSDSVAPCVLSERDSAVLEYLFNPLMQSPSQAEAFMENEKKERSEDCKEGDCEDLSCENLRLVKSLEAQGVREARNQNYAEATQLLTDAIELAPNYSSPYNNRAQVYRLLHQHDKSLEDLNKAIEISDPKGSGEPVNRRVAKLAYALRGFLRKGVLDDEDNGNSDLLRAAALGHSLASLEVNPFRTLCGQMVSVMMKEQCGIDA